MFLLILLNRVMKDRLKEFMFSKSLNAADLASKIGVQRSNVSHILSGRNFPGAQFIEKLLNAYLDLDARWFLTGSGSMFSSQPTLEDKRGDMGSHPSEASPDSVEAMPICEKEPKLVQDRGMKSISNRSGADMIVVFYHNRTYREYLPE